MLRSEPALKEEGAALRSSCEGRPGGFELRERGDWRAGELDGARMLRGGLLDTTTPKLATSIERDGRGGERGERERKGERGGSMSMSDRGPEQPARPREATSLVRGRD